MEVKLERLSGDSAQGAAQAGIGTGATFLLRTEERASQLIPRILEFIAAMPEQDVSDLAAALSQEGARRGKIGWLIEAVRSSQDPAFDAAQLEQAVQNASLRDRFLAETETASSEAIAVIGHSRSANRSALAYRWREQGRIFGVPHRGGYRYPLFQLDLERGRPKEVIREVLGILGGRFGDWGTALWFTGPNAWIEGRRPVDCLDDPVALLAAARGAVERPSF